MRRTSITLAVICVTAVGLALLLQPWSTAQVAEPRPFTGEVLGTVEGTPIYLDQAASRYAGLSTIHGMTTGPRSGWQHTLLQSLVDDAIVQREANSSGVRMTPAEIALSTASTLGDRTPEETNQFLKDSQATLGQLQYRIFINVLTARMFEHVTKDAAVSNREVRKRFEQTRSSYPEKNDEIAFAQAEPTLAQQMLFEEQQRIWTSWLEDRRAEGRYQIELAMKDWWKSVEAGA